MTGMLCHCYVMLCIYNTNNILKFIVYESIEKEKDITMVYQMIYRIKMS